jgi:hypothetical protein
MTQGYQPGAITGTTSSCDNQLRPFPQGLNNHALKKGEPSI